MNTRSGVSAAAGPPKSAMSASEMTSRFSLMSMSRPFVVLENYLKLAKNLNIPSAFVKVPSLLSRIATMGSSSAPTHFLRISARFSKKETEVCTLLRNGQRDRLARGTTVARTISWNCGVARTTNVGIEVPVGARSILSSGNGWVSVIRTAANPVRNE